MIELAQQLLNGVVTGAGFVLMALGVTILFGVLKVINFAHGILYVLGGYIAFAFMSSAGLAYWPSLALSILLTGCFSALLYPILLRWLSGRDLGASMILTFGLAMIIEEVIRFIWGAAPYSIPSPLTANTVQLGPVYVNAQLAFAVMGSAVLVGLLILALNKTRLGLQIRALAEDQTMAEMLGVRVGLLSSVTWGIGGALTGAAGALIIPAYTLESTSAFHTAIMAFAVVIVGGLGSIWGTVVAGLSLGIVTALVDGYVLSGMNEVIAFTLLLLILLFKPQGLLGRVA
jgi:branched-chain amino acid transport system permease protein